MKVRCVLFFLSCLIVSGCAASAAYSKLCDSWLDRNINDLINSWGNPEQSFIAPNGNTVYVFVKTEQIFIPPYILPSQTTYHIAGNRLYEHTTGWQKYEGYELNIYCRIYFETDPSGVIVTLRWEGNQCKVK